MAIKELKSRIALLTILLSCSLSVQSHSLTQLEQLKQAYPEHIQSVNEDYITWTDGTKMQVHDKKPNKSEQEKLDTPSLADQVQQPDYPLGQPSSIAAFHPRSDPGRIRYEAFFRKMYGQSAQDVERKLTTIYWMPKIFGTRYPLPVTTINGVDKKLSEISKELEQLLINHPDYKKYLENPGGLFNWRYIANTHRLSPHSFGMTIDINTHYANYWQWDLKKRGLPVKETTPLTYENHIPWEIVMVFEKNGFIWGGKWYHYDTMHFEYRPELLFKKRPSDKNPGQF